MSEKDETVFDEAEMVEDMPEEVQEQEEMEDDEMSVFNVSIPDESPKEKLERKGVKKEMDGSTLTIKEVFHTKIKTKAMDGSKIEPKPTQTGDKFFYPGKLGIRFAEENIVEYYPSFKYFVGTDGKINTIAKINRSGENEVTKLFNLAVVKIAKPADEISDKEFYDFLIGKEVKIKMSSGTYNKKKWFRNDIEKFV